MINLKAGKGVAAGLLAFVLVFMGIFGLTGIAGSYTVAAAEDDTEEAEPTVYLKDVTVYSAAKETVVTVPIYAQDVDLQCYDLTISCETITNKYTYLTGQTDGTGLDFEGYEDVNVYSDGEIRIVGVTLADGADAADGKVGEVSFVVGRNVTSDGIEIAVSIEVEELGFGTEAADVTVVGSTVTLNKSAAPEIVYGDADGDGDVDTDDVTVILQAYTGAVVLSDTQAEAADVDGDGTISVADAGYVWEYYLGLISALSPEEEYSAITEPAYTYTVDGLTLTISMEGTSWGWNMLSLEVQAPKGTVESYTVNTSFVSSFLLSGGNAVYNVSMGEESGNDYDEVKIGGLYMTESGASFAVTGTGILGTITFSEPTTVTINGVEVAITGETTEIEYGDVNGDHNVTVDDALLILRYYVGLDTLDDDALLRADVTGEGSVNVDDALYVLQYYVSLITEFPVEQQ